MKTPFSSSKVPFWSLPDIDKEVGFSSATWNTVAIHTLLVVTGVVALYIIPVTTQDIAGGGTIQLGYEAAESTTDAFLGATTGTTMDTGEIWMTGNSRHAAQFSQVMSQPLLASDCNIVYEIKTSAFTAGKIKFKVWWKALSEGATVVEGSGA